MIHASVVLSCDHPRHSEFSGDGPLMLAESSISGVESLAELAGWWVQSRQFGDERKRFPYPHVCKACLRKLAEGDPPKTEPYGLLKGGVIHGMNGATLQQMGGVTVYDEHGNKIGNVTNWSQSPGENVVISPVDNRAALLRFPLASELYCARKQNRCAGNPCKGECGCKQCHEDYQDFLSGE